MDVVHSQTIRKTPAVSVQAIMLKKVEGANRLFTAKYGIDLDGQGGNSCPGKVRDCYELVASDLHAPSMALTEISAVKLSLVARFANSLSQLTNAFEVARYLGARRIYLPGVWYVKQGSSSLACGIEVVNLPEQDIAEHAVKDALILEGIFFHADPFWRIIRKGKAYANAVLMSDCFNLRHETPLTQDDLVIHIRSGDIFKPGGKPHAGYGQPPLSFYQFVLSEREWSSISLVFENRLNPVIKPLIDTANDLCASVNIMSDGLRNDLEYLMRAHTLVVGRGSFASGLSVLSKNLKKVYYFDSMYHAWGNASIEAIQVMDKDRHYVEAVLSSNWRNDPDQRRLMIEYPLSALAFK